MQSGEPGSPPEDAPAPTERVGAPGSAVEKTDRLPELPADPAPSTIPSAAPEVGAPEVGAPEVGAPAPSAFRRFLASERTWVVALIVGELLRAALILFYRGPMNNLYSDAHRHLDNARHFLQPGPMGCSNPYFYQLFLWAVITVTKERVILLHLMAASLCVAYPLLFYRFARLVMHERVSALRFATAIAFLPSHAVMYTFFMNETLLLPLIGGALWATAAAAQRRSLWRFLIAALLWTCAFLTRSIALPMAIFALGWAAFHQRQRVLALAGALAIGAAGVTVASQHSVRILERKTIFGDNVNVTAYFASGALGYKVTYFKPGKYTYGYGFGSPSYAISPFDPFYKFKTQRKGTFNLKLNSELHGEDGKQAVSELFEKNKAMMPRLIFENLVFMTFGHSWPESGKESPQGWICLYERWIWFPLFCSVIAGSVLFFKRRRRFELVPAFALFSICALASAQLAVMEGRYRRPVEPLLFLTLFWLLEQARRKGAGEGAWVKPPSA